MCGIHGIVGYDEDAVGRMIAASRHRGPDGQGIWSDGKVTLGHNLLSITDNPAQSTQPWHMHGKVLVYNGEIYNYKELAKELNQGFATDTDTEVLMAGLCLHGSDFLAKCDGMFALAFYDPSKDELLLARDDNGAKPLYYGRIDGRLAFSSEINSLLEIGFPRKVDPFGFQLYFNNGHTTGPITMFDGIKRLTPGEIRKFNLSTGKKVITNLNDNIVDPFRGDRQEIVERLPNMLKESVSRTLMGRKQIGLFLSGGLDSSSILEELLAIGQGSPRTFTTRFNGLIPKSRCNEDADVAISNAQRLGVSNGQVEIDQHRYLDNLMLAIKALEEPKKSFSIPAYLATNRHMSQQGIVVTLSGDGGDELLAGYKHHKKPDWGSRYASLRAGFRPMADPKLHLSIQDMLDYQKSWIPKNFDTGDALNDFMMIECLSSLAEDFLMRNDKLGMSCGMEARFPMLSKPFRNFCRSLPGNLKTNDNFYNGGHLLFNKMILRDAYRDRMPEQIVDRAKTGWRAPIEEWVIGTGAHPAPDDGAVRSYFMEALMDREMMDLFSYSAADVTDRYLNNRDFHPADPTRLGPDGLPKGPHIGLASNKEMITIVMFSIWYKTFRMSM
jgi:asparagine synthase (glutamine-hydrolysing)